MVWNDPQAEGYNYGPYVGAVEAGRSDVLPGRHRDYTSPGKTPEPEENCHSSYQMGSGPALAVTVTGRAVVYPTTIAFQDNLWRGLHRQSGQVSGRELSRDCPLAKLDRKVAPITATTNPYQLAITRWQVACRKKGATRCGIPLLPWYRSRPKTIIIDWMFGCVIGRTLSVPTGIWK